MKELSNERMMTVKEVADVFGVTPESVKWNIRKLFPEKMKKGIETRLSELEVTEIKKVMIPTSQLVGASTELEMQQKAIEVMAWMQSKINEQQRRINLLIHDAKNYTTTEIAKELNLRSGNELNKILEDMKIQYKVNNTWVLSSRFSECGYESIKQQELENGKIIYNRHWTGKGRDFILNELNDIFKSEVE